MNGIIILVCSLLLLMAIVVIVHCHIIYCYKEETK